MRNQKFLMKADVDSLIAAGRHQRSADQASITAEHDAPAA
jgi:hypothetical protein